MDMTGFEANDLCADWLPRAAHQHPSASALVLEDGSFDYATLQSLTAQLCQRLGAQGLQPGGIMVVESRSSRLLAFLLHAALFADFVLFPLDPCLPAGQRERLLELVHADRILREDDAVRADGARVCCKRAVTVEPAAGVAGHQRQLRAAGPGQTE